MDNPLKNFFSSISRLRGGEEESAVGIDIGSSAIKVVEIKRKGGKAILETYGAIALGTYADTDAGRVTNLPVEKVILALQEVLKKSDSTSTSVALSLPVQSSLIFTIELPAQIEDDKIAAIIPIEARKYIPVPITEVSIDYFKIPKKEYSFEEANAVDTPAKEEEKINILVVTTQNDAVARYRSIVSGCKLSASFFEIEIFSSILPNF